jgi:hypothetical protein
VIELLLDWVWCLWAVRLIKNEPRLHWHLLWLEELAMELMILFKELGDVCIQMKLDPILRLLNFKSEKRVHDLPSLAGKVEICSIELLKVRLKLQLEFLGSRDECEIVNESSSMEDEIVSVTFHQYRLLVVNHEVLMLFHPG